MIRYVLVMASCLIFFLWLREVKPTKSFVYPEKTSSQSEFLMDEPIKPIPFQLELDSNKVSLGSLIFHDPQLSQDNTVSCASCHQLEKGGVDNLTLPVGIKKRRGTVNTPTVFNSFFNFRQFWDGRAKDLYEQIDGPIHHPDEMNSSWPEILSKFKKNINYKNLFYKIYQSKINKEDIKDSLVHFLISLYTPNSRFDQYLRGSTEALSKEEQEGYHSFKKYGCIGCHQGVNIGGNMFQKMGRIKDYFLTQKNSIKTSHNGLYNISKKEEDRYKFKVPSLRNVALTAPYFHDGSAKNLDEAVKVMAEHQIGQKLKEREVFLIVSFLKTLTGEYQGKLLSGKNNAK